MTGSLQIKNNKYDIVLNDYVNGKRKQKWVKTELPIKGNKRKAEQLDLCRLCTRVAVAGQAPCG